MNRKAFIILFLCMVMTTMKANIVNKGLSIVEDNTMGVAYTSPSVLNSGCYIVSGNDKKDKEGGKTNRPHHRPSLRATFTLVFTSSFSDVVITVDKDGEQVYISEESCVDENTNIPVYISNFGSGVYSVHVSSCGKVLLDGYIGTDD